MKYSDDTLLEQAYEKVLLKENAFDDAYEILSKYFEKGSTDEDSYIHAARELKNIGFNDDDRHNPRSSHQDDLDTLVAVRKWAVENGWEFDVEAIMDQFGASSEPREQDPTGQDEEDFEGEVYRRHSEMQRGTDPGNYSF